MWPKVCIVLMLSLSVGTHADIFTTKSEIKQLLETYEIVKDELDYYIKKEEKRLTILERYLEIYKRDQQKSLEDIPKYLSNPISAFTLIKRLTLDLDRIKLNIKTRTEDFRNAAAALTRIQATYNLNVAYLAESRLHSTNYSAPMATSDCYELGRTLYKTKDFVNSLGWNNRYPFSILNISSFTCYGYFELVKTSLYFV